MLQSELLLLSQQSLARQSSRFAQISSRWIQSTSRHHYATEVDPPKTIDALPGRRLKDYQNLISRELYRALTVSPFQYDTPSPVQEAVFDLLPSLANDFAKTGDDAPKDLLVKAKTGTGKTIAFLLPALQARINAIQEYRDRIVDPDKPQRNARRDWEMNTCGVLVVSPTRELATQIANEASKLAHHMKLAKVQLFVGGASKTNQIRAWRHLRRDVVVATPGRLLDMIESVPEIKQVLATTRTLVLDEADTLLDMGFKDELERIIEALPPKDERQTFLFSATVAPAIQQIARKAMKANHLFIDTVPAHEANVHMNIPQYATVLSDAKDQVPHILRVLAHDMLSHPEGGKAIIFAPTTRLTELFAQIVEDMKKHLPWGARRTITYEMHSKKSQGSRDSIATRFRGSRGGYHILITSDVSARGVDYPGVTRVIQIGVPSSRDIYIHRLGRTGRAGKEGRGDLVLLPWEAAFLRELNDLPIQKITVDALAQEVDEMATRQDSDPQGADYSERSSRLAQAPKQEAFRLGKVIRSTSVMGSMQPDVAERLSQLDAAYQQEVMPGLDSFGIKEAFGSMLGYYVPRAYDLNINKSVLVKGLQEWAQKSVGLPEEPYVSEALLKKMGVREPRARETSSRRSTHTRGSSDSLSRWQGRGSSRTRNDNERKAGWKGERYKPRSQRDTLPSFRQSGADRSSYRAEAGL